MSEESRTDQYWKLNLKLVSGLLCIWFVSSYVCGIFLVEWLNQWYLGGFPVGFWFAQQGSILIFIGLILTYCLIMDRVDADFTASSEKE
jgi:putative solute:sodium symporter small subunit